MSANFTRAIATAALAFAGLQAGPIAEFQETKLVSDLPGVAAHQDADLKNAWGISFGATTPFWVSDNGTGLATLYDANGVKQGLVVGIPGAGGTAPGTGVPTGQVFDASRSFSNSRFIFAGEDGVISGWSGGTAANILFDNSAAGSVYKGLAIGTEAGQTRLYATDFHNNRIDVFGSSVSGTFTDPNLPAGFAPFGIQAINGSLYVTYAKQDAARHDDVAGPGNGFVNVFDLNGNFVRRFASDDVLNSPWGLAMAPAGFRALGGDLLVGNFGDGMINAFDASGALVGTIADLSGKPIFNDGLWGLAFRAPGSGFNPNALYLTAGLNGEADGLFARIEPAPEPGTFILLGAGLGAFILRARALKQMRP